MLSVCLSSFLIPLLNILFSLDCTHARGVQPGGSGNVAEEPVARTTLPTMLATNNEEPLTFGRESVLMNHRLGQFLHSRVFAVEFGVVRRKGNSF